MLEDAVRAAGPTEDLGAGRPAAAAGEGARGGQAAADRRRGRRGRGAVHAGGQRDPQDLPGGRGQVAVLRRPAQGVPRRTWRSSPAARWCPPRSGSSSTRSGSRCSAGPAGSTSPRTTPRSSTAAARRRASTTGSAQLAQEIEDTDSDWDREKLQERLAKLAGGVAVIKVGAATEIELKERKHRIEDAVLGHQGRGRGGHHRRRRGRPGARGRGARWTSGWPATRPPASPIVRRALYAPLRWIAANAGLEGAVVVARVAERPTARASTPTR